MMSNLPFKLSYFSFFCCYYVESEEAKFVLKTMLSAKQSLVRNKVSDHTVGYHNQIKPEIQREGAKIGINNDYNPK